MDLETHELRRQLSILHKKLEWAKSQDVKKSDYIQSLTDLILSIEFYMDKAEATINNIGDIYLNTIKKQAFIIKLSGIEYPTINQSIGHITDIYLQQTGMTELIGNHESNISINIDIV